MEIAGVAAIVGVEVVETAEIVRTGEVGVVRGIGAVRAMEVAIGVGVARAMGEGPAGEAIAVRIAEETAALRAAMKFPLKNRHRHDFDSPLLYLPNSSLSSLFVPLHRNE